MIGVAVLLVLTASQSAGQVIPGPEGPVEFIGLQQWDAQELFDAIREIDPDLPYTQEVGGSNPSAPITLTGFGGRMLSNCALQLDR